jgi:hypothetical protein
MAQYQLFILSGFRGEMHPARWVETGGNGRKKGEVKEQ